MEQIRLIRVFISSPNDVSAEREVLDEVVASINRAEGQAHGVRLELFKGENEKDRHYLRYLRQSTPAVTQQQDWAWGPTLGPGSSRHDQTVPTTAASERPFLSKPAGAAR